MPVSKRSTGGDAIYVDRNGNTDALPSLKPSTKGKESEGQGEKERKKERERVGEGWVRWEKGTEINTPKTRFSFKIIGNISKQPIVTFFFLS